MNTKQPTRSLAATSRKSPSRWFAIPEVLKHFKHDSPGWRFAVVCAICVGPALAGSIAALVMYLLAPNQWIQR